MGKDKGRDRSQDRRLLECKSCGQRFYSYRITKEAECPNCQAPTAREVKDENIEDGNLPQTGRFSEGAGSGHGCLGPILVFLCVLAAGFAAYWFRDEIAAQFRPANAPANTPANEAPREPPNAPGNTPADTPPASEDGQ
jgi:hypothetical protein